MGDKGTRDEWYEPALPQLLHISLGHDFMGISIKIQVTKNQNKQVGLHQKYNGEWEYDQSKL
jgi:hypothetical protein